MMVSGWALKGGSLVVVEAVAVEEEVNVVAAAVMVGWVAAVMAGYAVAEMVGWAVEEMVGWAVAEMVAWVAAVIEG